jgi:hypothetical protein
MPCPPAEEVTTLLGAVFPGHLRSFCFSSDNSPVIEAGLYKWLTMFLVRVCFFIFYLPIAPPSQAFMELYLSQSLMKFYLRSAASSLVTYHLTYDLHPLCIVMPILLLL